MRNLRWLFGLLVPLLLAGCVASTPGELGRVDPDDESGMGGTGLMAESGLGGTGIIGEITGFGSIFVNGVEVEISGDTRLMVDGERVGQHAFARGEVVAVRVVPRQRLQLAVELYLRHEVIGPVQHVDPALRQFVVLGQTVQLDTRRMPQPGQAVAVSGFRDAQGVIHATLVRPETSTRLLLVGEVQQRGRDWYVGAQRLRLATGMQLRAGQRVRLRGRLQAGIFRVTRHETLPALPFKQPLQRLIWQGFVTPLAADRYRLADAQIEIDVRTRLTLQQDQPLQLELRFTAGRWQAIRQLSPASLPKGRPRPTSPPLPAAPARGTPRSGPRPGMPSRPLPMPGRFM